MTNANPVSPKVTHELPAKIVNVCDLLSDPTLRIPQYQRPYKWTTKNVNQLFSDIRIHHGKSAYRLGTVVFHEQAGKKNIVDGQQRTISLLLAARALITKYKDAKLGREDVKDSLHRIESNMINPFFESAISHHNIHNNYLEIDRIISRADFTEEHVAFFLEKCEVVTVVLHDVSEAFQFFDSQNARGRDLEPHDLLKAYHLREFSPLDERLKVATVAQWESSDTQLLAALFSQYLYRIRSWSNGASARYFSKVDSDLFKGVNIETVGSYPYVRQLQIAHHFVDEYNDNYERKVDGRKMVFPFHLDQIIINGRRFFELIAHYQNQVSGVTRKPGKEGEWSNASGLDAGASEIIDTINNYEARTRTGDRYVRTMFDCLLIYYIDKFGKVELSRAIEKIFIWAYTLRLTMQVVQLASMDNHVLENNLFTVIKDATRPTDFISFGLPKLESTRSTKTKEIEGLFERMNYL